MKTNYLNILEKKRKRNFFIISFLLLPVFMIITYDLLGFHTNQDMKIIIINNAQENLCTSNTYQLVDPINISSWTDWANYSFITGNGTYLNPFIIENIEINGTGVKTMQSGNDTLLDISYIGIFIDSNGSFIIRNCKISHVSLGIHLSIGISPGVYPISDVEISDCSFGIYSRWPHIDTNITNCYIHDCNLVSVKAQINLRRFLDYGGIGMWVRNEGAIQNCRIEDCSFGMTAGLVQEFHNNELINCGFIPDYQYMYLMDYDSSNTVNGKPIGIFGSYWGDDNLVFTQNDASQYGQLIFANCNNLTLSNIHITEQCSVGVQIISLGLDQTTYLNNIICENQKLGVYIEGRNIIAANLYVKNCAGGISLIGIRDSKFSKVLTDNTDVPIYAITPIRNFSIEIERSTRLNIFDNTAWYGNLLHVESLSISYDVPMSYIPELGILGYSVQFNDTNTYQLSLFVPPDMKVDNFTIFSVPPYARPGEPTAIPGYPLLWFLSLMVIGLLILIELSRKSYQK